MASDESARQPLLSLKGIAKTFGAVHALREVTVDIPAGQVTALVGDNGAGKSTTDQDGRPGIWEPERGQIEWEGRQVHIQSPREAAGARHRDRVSGPRAVRQPRHRPEHVPGPRAPAAWHAGRADHGDQGASETLARSVGRQPCGRSVSPLRSLSGGQRQSVAVAKAVMSNAKLVIMDEPTAALGVSQTTMVLGLIKRLASRGVAVLVISHNLNDVFAGRGPNRRAVPGQLVAEGPGVRLRHPKHGRIHDDRNRRDARLSARSPETDRRDTMADSEHRRASEIRAAARDRARRGPRH